jgi:predicted DNA-binding transcriptional regulator YafY
MLEGFRADTTGLDDAEAQVLFAYLGLETFGDLGLSREARSVLDKLAASAPSRLDAPAGRLREVVHVDRRRWFAAPDDLTHLPVLRRACVQGRRVRVAYTASRDDGPVSRTLDPLGLVENGNRWYLVAYHRGAPHTYRLARVGTVGVLDEPSRVPPGARLAAVWDELRSGFEALPGPAVTATLRLRADAADELRGALRTLVVSGGDLRVGERTATHVEVTADFRLPRSVVGFALGSAGAAEIVAPTKLRDQARAAAEASLALLRGPGQPPGQP